MRDLNTGKFHCPFTGILIGNNIKESFQEGQVYGLIEL
jgi:hypothetical protein